MQPTVPCHRCSSLSQALLCRWPLGSWRWTEPSMSLIYLTGILLQAGRFCRLAHSISYVSRLKPRSEGTRRPCRILQGCQRGGASTQRKRDPGAQCGSEPLLPPHDWDLLPSVVAASLASHSLTLSTWRRKTGNWALPGIGTQPSSARGCKEAA